MYARKAVTIATLVQPIRVVSRIVRATTTLMIANASMGTTSRNLKTNASVIHGVFGK